MLEGSDSLQQQEALRSPLACPGTAGVQGADIRCSLGGLWGRETGAGTPLGMGLWVKPLRVKLSPWAGLFWGSDLLCPKPAVRWWSLDLHDLLLALELNLAAGPGAGEKSLLPRLMSKPRVALPAGSTKGWW